MVNLKLAKARNSHLPSSMQPLRGEQAAALGRLPAIRQNHRPHLMRS
jgi:hypothetical protein